MADESTQIEENKLNADAHVDGAVSTDGVSPFRLPMKEVANSGHLDAVAAFLTTLGLHMVVA